MRFCQCLLVALHCGVGASLCPPAFAQEAAVPDATAAAGSIEANHQAFETARNEWIEVFQGIQQLQLEKKGKPAAERERLDQEILKVRSQADQIVDRLTATGLAVYKADPTNYQDVNQTLFALADFHVLGDARGDGGDQYEKALPLIRGLLEAGAGQEKPLLWLTGAVSAVCLNEFDLAEQYFAQAEAAGLLGPAAVGANVPDRLSSLAGSLRDAMPQLKQNWAVEKDLRAAEEAANNLPRVKFTTDDGDIVIELFEDQAPEAVANFITLVKKGFYDGVPFHRVLPGFMAQGGDPTGTGSGGPGYSIRCECYSPTKYRKHFRGSLSMAHAGRNTGGSQFFLTFVPTSYLDGRHTVFGRVAEGMDVAASIKRRDPDDRGTQPEKILRAEVLRDRGHKYTFEKLPSR